MRRPVRHRLTVCLATVAVTTALGALAAPAALADPVASSMPNVSHSRGVAQSMLAIVPPFGRRLG